MPNPSLPPAMLYLGGFMTAIYLAVEIYKALNARSIQKKNDNNGFGREDQQKLITLYKQHQIVDEDGTPIWYVPRSMLKLQSAAVEELKKLNSTMESFECPYIKKKED
jgi:hypothetical protein